VATITQASLIVGANALAYLLRFDGSVPDTEVRVFALGLPVLLAIRLTWIHVFGLFRDIWRYSGMRDMQSVVASTALGSLTFWGVVTVVPSPAYGSRVAAMRPCETIAWSGRRSW
jgi:FlaA1/EpsC-like NDP-sugar epimerase